MIEQVQKKTPTAPTKPAKKEKIDAKIDNETMKLLKGIGHQLKPVVIIGNNGVTQAIYDEVDRALTDHEIIKVKLAAGSKEERQQAAEDLAEKTDSQLIQNVGRMALLLRNNPNATPRLSNLVRFTY